MSSGFAVKLLTAVLVVLSGGWAIPSCMEVAHELDVQFSGCDAVWHGPACAPSASRPLTLWIANSEAPGAMITLDGKEWSASAEQTCGGARYTMEVPPRAQRLVVTSRRGPDLLRWSLTFRSQQPVAALEQATKLRREGRYQEGIARLRKAQSDTAVSQQGRLLSMLARLHFDAGENERGFALLRRSIAHHQRNGRLHDVIWDGNMLAFKLINIRGSYHEARMVLDDLQSPLALFPEGKAIIAYTRAIIFRDTGDYRNALKHFSEAADWAARLGQASFARSVAQSHAAALAEMGRAAKAEAIFDELRADGDAAPQPKAPTVADAHLAANHCWVRLLADEAAQRLPCPTRGTDNAELKETAKRCDEALERLLSTGQYTDEQRANLMVNNALVALHMGEVDEARAAVATAHALLPNPPAHIDEWLRDVRGRVQLCNQQPARALETYERLGRQAQERDSLPTRWRAMVGRGRALEALARLEEAAGVYQQAEDLLALLSMDVPLGAGRGRFLADRQLSARLLVDLLVRLERPAEAFAVARRSRQRLLMSLWRSFQRSEASAAERQQWERAIAQYRQTRADISYLFTGDSDLPLDMAKARRAAVADGMAEARADLEQALAVWPQERAQTDAGLASPAPGEVMLSYHPDATGQWYGFAADQDQVVVKRIVRPRSTAASALSAALLAPFGAQIARAERVAILPHGTLSAWLPHEGEPLSLDIHALPWPPASGEPLVAHVPVVYRLDLPVAAEVPSEEAGPEPQQVLVVADPGENLRHARLDGPAVNAIMTASAGEPSVLLQGADATSGAVTTAIEHADFFHFSGHGDARGLDGWQSALRLAAGGQLALTDVLALERVPRQVVLSSCEAIGDTREVKGQRLGLAQAFVIRGAHYAIATVGKVSDRDASRMTRALYHRLSKGEFVDAAAALRAAQQDVRHAQPGVDWARYRVMTP